MGKQDAAYSPDRRHTTSKQNKYISKCTKICNKYDQTRDTNKDIKINELVFEAQILQGINFSYIIRYYLFSVIHRRADKSLTRPTSPCILSDGENISFDVSLVINSTNIPPIMIINRIYETQNFCRCSLFPSWSG